EQRLPGCLGEKREGLREHEGKWGAQQPIQHPDHTWRGVLLYPEHCPHAGCSRHAVFQGLATKANARRRYSRIQCSAGQRHRLPLSVDEQGKILEQRGVPASGILITAETLRLVRSERSAQRLRDLAAGLERIGCL